LKRLGHHQNEWTVSPHLFIRIRYQIVSFVLILIGLFYTLNATWRGDFWEHASVIRELSTNPWSPKHPQLLLNLPHEFYSPYAIFLALIARSASWSPVQILSVISIVNLVVFLVALRIFLSTLRSAYGDDSKWMPEAVAFYLIIFTLFLWGHLPWVFSGFFHAAVLGYVLSYPSFMAISVSLVIFSIYLKLISKPSIPLYFLFSVLFLFVLLSHPITVPFIAVVVLGLTLDFQHHRKRWIVPPFLMLICGLVALAWPYYPFLQLFSSKSQLIHESNRPLYQGVLRATYPLVIGVPVLIARFKKRRTDFIVFSVLVMSCLYVYGFLVAEWSFGRLLSHIIFCLHLGLAIWAATLERKLLSGEKTPPLQLASGVFVILVLIATSLDTPRYILSRYDPVRFNHYYLKYKFVGFYAEQYETVLADIEASWVIPAFNGKVVASYHPLVFVPDNEKRTLDIIKFYQQNAKDEERDEIINRYKVGYVLLDRTRHEDSQRLIAFLKNKKGRVFANGDLILFKLPKSGITEGLSSPY